jgi:hypothetical protein
MDITDLQNRFTYHTVDKEHGDKMKNIILNLLNVALLIDESMVDGREKSLAITALETAMFWSNSAIAREL